MPESPRLPVFTLICAAILAYALTIAVHGAEEGTTDPLLVLELRTPDGQFIEKAEAYLISPDMDMPATTKWTPAADGRVIFPRESKDLYVNAQPPQRRVRVVVRAPGRAWVMRDIDLEKQTDPVPFTMPPGREILVSLRTVDRRIAPPEAAPIIFTEGQSVAAWVSCVQDYQKRRDDPRTAFNAVVPEPLGSGTFSVRIPDDLASFYVLVDAPDFLRAWQSGPHRLGDLRDGRLALELPAPVRLEVEVTPDEDTASAYRECGVAITAVPDIPDGGWSFHVDERFHIGKSFTAVFDDLAPAGYSVRAFTGTKATRNDRTRDSYYSEQQWIEVKGETPGQATFALATWDESRLRRELKGDHEVTLKLVNADGSPASGRRYTVSFSQQRFSRHLTFDEGTIPRNGVVVLRNVPPSTVGVMELEVDGQRLGQVVVKRNEPETRLEFQLAPAVGSPAPDITLTRLDDGSNFTLDSLRGQVVLLEFWATWCGPCQQPMAHNNEIVARRADTWKNRAVIIGASIDNSISTIRGHVNKRGWHEVLQAFCGDGAWKSIAAKRYAVTAVPTAYLIDRDGTIVWSGHPGSIDVEKEIDELLK